MQVYMRYHIGQGKWNILAAVMCLCKNICPCILMIRNVTCRFLEVHVGEFSDDELRTVLHSRSELPPSFCSKLVEIMRELQRRRQGSRVFSGKESFITVRDLLRLAKRQPASMQVRQCFELFLVSHPPDEKIKRSHLEDMHWVVMISIRLVFEGCHVYLTT